MSSLTDCVETYRTTALEVVVDRVTNAVEQYVREGGADYAELSDVIQNAIGISIPTWSNVHTMDDGGFVDAVIWVPKSR